MKTLLKYLKPYVWLIVAIFLLLFAQAMSDLSLPSYMSNIVNVGIQQNGIDNPAPEVIRASELNKAFLFMTEDEKTLVNSNYVLLNRNMLTATDYAQYVKIYPALSDVALYRLNTKDKSEIAILNTIFKKYITVVFAIEQNGLKSYSSSIQLPNGVDPFVAISKLPASQLADINTAIKTQLAAFSEAALKQYASVFLKAEYQTIGMNISKIQTNYMLKIGLLMLLLTLASATCSIIVGYISAKIAAGLGRNLRRNLFERVESFSNTEFDKFSTASLITRSTNDITQIQLLMVMLFRIVFYAPIIAVGGILKVIGADSSMLWIIGAAVGTLLTLITLMFFIAIPKFQIVQNLVDKLNLVTREILTGLMVIRAFNTQRYEERKFDKANQDLTRTSLFINRVMVFMMPAMMLLMNGVMVLIVWVGAHQVDKGSMQVGDMMAFMQYSMQIIMAFLMVSIVFIMLPRASVSAQRIGEVLNTEPSITDPQNPIQFDRNIRGTVEFRDVSFCYPGAEDNVLKHISFKARPGQTTAFVGSTGSGKTTLINLIPRFYDVTEGKVLVDGADVREVTQRDLREKIGYVGQKAVLFSGTIESNIKYANENASVTEIRKFAEISQAQEFITSSELGLQTAVAQGGTNYSGGQKQRLSIARALAKKPEIFIFDDSFSALDFKTDAALRRALKTETNNATVLIVTQRVSTILSADQIVVLNDGEIAGVGTHKELMASSDVYREIALSQLSKEELE